MSTADDLIHKAVLVCRDYIVPDSPITELGFVDQMLQLFDGPAYRAYEAEKAEKGPAQTGPIVAKADVPDTFRTGHITGATTAKLTTALGFSPDNGDGGNKVSVDWYFTLDGKPCGCWDWKGSMHHGQFSTFGPREQWEAFAQAHGFTYTHERGDTV